MTRITWNVRGGDFYASYDRQRRWVSWRNDAECGRFANLDDAQRRALDYVVMM